MATMAVTTLPISSACTGAGSPLSAKNSMYTTMMAKMNNSITHSGAGTTPTAPWTRSMRACSRAEV
jgi:hypothetical protein